MQIKIRRATTTSRFSQTQIKEIEGLAGNVAVDKLAKQFGMEEETFCEILKHQKPALRAYKKGRTIGAAENLQEQMKTGNTGAIKFFSKLYSGWDNG